MNLVESIKLEFQKFEQKKQELCEKLRVEFPQLIKPILDRSIRINSITWNQYTPYFMDGNECVFSTNIKYMRVNDEDDDIQDCEWLSESIYKTLENEEELKQAEELHARKGYRSGVEIGRGGYIPNPKRDELEYNVVKDLQEILTSIDDQFYKDLFGDHVEVTVYRDGRIEVSEYDHE